MIDSYFLVQFRYLFVFSLTFLLLTEDVYAWRRLRKFFRKVGRVIKRIPKEAANAVKTIAQVRTAVDAVKGVGAAVGKRSTDDKVRILLKPDILKVLYDYRLLI